MAYMNSITRNISTIDIGCTAVSTVSFCHENTIRILRLDLDSISPKECNEPIPVLYIDYSGSYRSF